MKKPVNIHEQLTTARVLHKAGLVADVEGICRKILNLESDNLEAISLLAETLRRKGDMKAALKLWKRAVDAKSPPWIHLRSLDGYLRSLLVQGARNDALRLLRRPIPVWPVVRIPDADEREMLMSLARVLAARIKGMSRWQHCACGVLIVFFHGQHHE